MIEIEEMKGLLLIGIRKAKECSRYEGKRRIRKTNNHLRRLIKK